MNLGTEKNSPYPTTVYKRIFSCTFLIFKFFNFLLNALKTLFSTNHRKTKTMGIFRKNIARKNKYSRQVNAWRGIHNCILHKNLADYI
jgi:hypothetical protein